MHRSTNFTLGPGRFTPRERVSHTRHVKAWNVTQNRSVFSKEENSLYPIKYQNDIRWVSQNTTLYYGVRCQKIHNMFRPFSIRPSPGLTWWTKEEKITMLQSTHIHSML